MVSHQLLSFILLGLLIQIANGQDRWASPTGGGTGTSIGSPTTLSTAYAEVGANSNLWLLPGTYNISSIFLFNRNIQVTIVGTSERRDQTVIRCAGPSTAFRASTGEHTFNRMQFINCVTSIEHTGAAGSSLTIRNCSFTGVSFGGSGVISALNSQGTVIVEDSIFQTSVSPYVIPGQGVLTLRRSHLLDRGGGTISSCGVEGSMGSIIIEDTVFINTWCGVTVYDGASCQITNSSFYSNLPPDAPSTRYMFRCLEGSIVLNSGNTFCGHIFGNVVTTNCPAISNQLLTHSDSCRRCSGLNQDKDCNGVCYGSNLNCPRPKSIYVNSVAPPGGNGTMISPYNSIQIAINQADNKDTIYLFPGIFNISTSLTIQSSKSITIRKLPSSLRNETIIRCTSPTTLFTSQFPTSYDSKLSWITISGCRAAVVIATESGLTLDNVVFLNNIGTSGDPVAINNVGGAVFLLNSQILSTTTTNLVPAVSMLEEDSRGAFGYIRQSRFLSNQRFVLNVAGQRSLIDVHQSTFQTNGEAGEPSVLRATDSNSRVIITRSSFNGNASPLAQCAIATPITVNDNSYCNIPGDIGSYLSSCTWTETITNSTNVFNCGLCSNSIHTFTDCGGECFGERINDRVGNCCFERDLDCDGVCSGNSTRDIFGTCCFSSLIDCEGICNGGKLNDSSIPPKCCFSNETDCSNICFGIREFDNSTIEPRGCCILSNETDCLGICFGGREFDNSTIPQCCFRNETDCAGICFDNRTLDNSTIPQCCYEFEMDCSRICGGDKMFDNSLPNPLCCSNSSMDCSRICNGTSVFDITYPEPLCCLESFLDCAGYCNGTSNYDNFGLCCNLDNDTDCNGLCFGNNRTDINGICCDPIYIVCNICYGNSSLCPSSTTGGDSGSGSVSSSGDSTSNDVSSSSSSSSSSSTGSITGSGQSTTSTSVSSTTSGGSQSTSESTDGGQTTAPTTGGITVSSGDINISGDTGDTINEGDSSGDRTALYIILAILWAIVIAALLTLCFIVKKVGNIFSRGKNK